MFFKNMKRYKIMGVCIVLSIVTGVKLGLYFSKPVQNDTINITDVKNKSDINDLEKDVEELQNNFKNTAEIIIGRGDISMSYVFSNKDECVMSESNGNPLKALHNKLFKREIKYTAFYTYNYVYDLSNIKVEIRDNKIIIYLHENSIVIKDLSEDYSKGCIDESYGWLSSDFSPSEMTAIQSHCKVQTNNYLITKHDNFSKSIENLVNIINKMCQELNIDKEEYELKVFENRTLTTKNNFMEVKNERIVATI